MEKRGTVQAHDFLDLAENFIKILKLGPTLQDEYFWKHFNLEDWLSLTCEYSCLTLLPAVGLIFSNFEICSCKISCNGGCREGRKAFLCTTNK